MRDKIKELLEDLLPMVDFDSDFLFSELDSLRHHHIDDTLRLLRYFAGGR